MTEHSKLPIQDDELSRLNANHPVTGNLSEDWEEGCLKFLQEIKGWFKYDGPKDRN